MINIKIIVYTSNRCNPCKQYKEILNNNDIKYTEKSINNEDNLNEARTYGVSATPTTIIFDEDNNIVDMFTGIQQPNLFMFFKS